jgi:hypothetical protein
MLHSDITAHAKLLYAHAKEVIEGEDAGATRRLLVNVFHIAWATAVRDEFYEYCRENHLDTELAFAKLQMSRDGYQMEDPICTYPGTMPQVCMFDEKQAVCVNYAMSQVVTLSALYLNKLRAAIEVTNEFETSKLGTADKESKS